MSQSYSRVPYEKEGDENDAGERMETRYDGWGDIVNKAGAKPTWIQEFVRGRFQTEPREAAVRRVCRSANHGATKFASRQRKAVLFKY